MKTHHKMILSLLLLFVCGVGVTGDLGGGGSAQPQCLELSAQQKSELLSLGSAHDAYVYWVNNLDEKKRSELLHKVFQEHILPQLVNQ